MNNKFQYVISLGGIEGTICLNFVVSDQIITPRFLSQTLVYKLQCKSSTSLLSHTSSNVSVSTLDKTIPSTSSSLIQPQYLFLYNSRPLLYFDSCIETRSNENVIFLTAILRGAICGGKGGFGANLRASGRTAAKKSTTDFSLCRDLQGRRLRDVNNEIRLRTWLAPAEVARREALGSDYKEIKGEGGLTGWFLGVPSWADGISGKSKRSGNLEELKATRRKTSICVDWKRARDGKKPPIHAPRWWGCPRGRMCEFAHGDEELRGGGIAESVAETAKQRALAERQARLEEYTKNIYVYGTGEGEDEKGEEGEVQRMTASVAQGMQQAASSSLSLISGSILGLKRPRFVETKIEEEEEEEDDEDGSIMLGFAKRKSKSSRSLKKQATWTGISKTSLSSNDVYDIAKHHDEESLTFLTPPPRVLQVSEKYIPSKWLVVSDAPEGKAVSGEAAAAVEYLSIVVTSLESHEEKKGRRR
jgi:hypothetical protein